MDASKAPGYRGNSINSPVSSKASSNSATPPSTALPQQQPSNAASCINPNVPNGNSVVSQSQIQQASAQNQGAIGQQSQNQQAQSSQSAQQHASSSSNPVLPTQIQRPIMSGNQNQHGSRGSMDQTFGRPNMFDPLQTPPVQSNNLLQQFGGGESQNFGMPPQNLGVSRLNPKANSFLSNCAQSKQNPPQSSNQFGGNFPQSMNSSNMMKSGSGVMPPFFNPPPQSSNGRQMHQQNPQQPPQRTWFPDFGGLESPSMSPNQQNGVMVPPPVGQNPVGQQPPPQSQMTDDSRKIARPIGSERASMKHFPYQMGGPPPWMVDNKPQQQWPTQSVYPPMTSRPYEDMHADYYPVRNLLLKFILALFDMIFFPATPNGLHDWPAKSTQHELYARRRLVWSVHVWRSC